MVSLSFVKQLKNRAGIIGFVVSKGCDINADDDDEQTALLLFFVIN